MQYVYYYALDQYEFDKEVKNIRKIQHCIVGISFDLYIYMDDL